MYAITGVTGKVGGALARNLLDAGHKVRAVLRDTNKSGVWAALGCDIAIAEMSDPVALTAAFRGVDGVFILPPSNFDPEEGFPDAIEVINAVKTALHESSPKKIVCLSTIGAQAQEVNLLTQRTLMEQALSALSIPVTFLRPGWFIENSRWDVTTAREDGVIHSFLQPLDKPVPMVATADVGQTAANLLLETWDGVRIVELEGPERVSPNDLAAAFSRVLGRPVHAAVIARDTWKALFISQGMKNPVPRMRMLDGFNEGFIDFVGPLKNVVKGKVALDDVLKSFV
jgi:uncharacterized protein YbjT (DUF2867 family)